jgi:hypothetical protein
MVRSDLWLPIKSVISKEFKERIFVYGEGCSYRVKECLEGSLKSVFVFNFLIFFLPVTQKNTWFLVILSLNDHTVSWYIYVSQSIQQSTYLQSLSLFLLRCPSRCAFSDPKNFFYPYSLFLRPNMIVLMYSPVLYKLTSPWLHI